MTDARLWRRMGQNATRLRKISVTSGCTIGQQMTPFSVVVLHFTVSLTFQPFFETICYSVNTKLHCVYSIAVFFLFRCPPCQRLNMTLVEVSQPACSSLCVRNIRLFVHWKFCKPGMVLASFFFMKKLYPKLSLSLRLEPLASIPNAEQRCEQSRFSRATETQVRDRIDWNLAIMTNHFASL